MKLPLKAGPVITFNYRRLAMTKWRPWEPKKQRSIVIGIYVLEILFMLLYRKSKLIE